jgi:8-oxoguanine deaminase
MSEERSIWLANPLAVLSEGDARGGLVITGSEITELVPGGGRPSAPAERFDAAGLVIIPGLINTHHHWYQTLTRAWAPVADSTLFGWLVNLYPVWAELTPEDLVLATRVAVAELLLSGCTTAADHHYVFPPAVPDGIDLQVEVVREAGIRALLTRGSMSLGTDDGGLPPQAVVQDHDTILAESERLVRTHHQRGPGAMIQIGLAPCSPFSVTRELMVDSAVLAEQLDVRLHTHLAETIDEEEFCAERFGLRTVDYLDSVGWLTDRSWLGHGIHFDDEEIARLGAAGTGIAHCPSSNMRLGSGIARVVELEEAGSPVGIGVDGSASNDASNMIIEARQAMLLQRLRYGTERVPVRRALDWATAGSARVLGRDDLGRIAVGRQADLALFALNELAFSGSHDPIAALLLCGAQRAEHVLVAGEWRVRGGELVGVDIPKLIAEHSAAARRLLVRATG